MGSLYIDTSYLIGQLWEILWVPLLLYWIIVALWIYALED